MYDIDAYCIEMVFCIDPRKCLKLSGAYHRNQLPKLASNIATGYNHNE